MIGGGPFEVGVKVKSNALIERLFVLDLGAIEK